MFNIFQIIHVLNIIFYSLVVVFIIISISLYNSK